MLDFHDSGAVEVDLGAGRARHEDLGGGEAVDVINGRVWGVSGSDSSDVLRGSESDEVFVGTRGTDIIDGGGGYDSLYFGSSAWRLRRLFFDIGDIEVDLGAGTATGKDFSYRLSNIEAVYGGPGNDTLKGGYGDSSLYGGGGNDELILGDEGNDEPRDGWVGGSAGNDRIVYTDSGPLRWQGIGYKDLEPGIGITATIDGTTNNAIVDKGSAGTDTIVDIVKPLRVASVGLHGTHSDDIFHLTLGEGQRMSVRGYAGDDTFNVQSTGGSIDIDYWRSPRGVDVDLGAGRANDDGYGDVDTIVGNPQSVRGSEHDDVIRGSDNDESFRGSGGDDVIDGGGGYDRLNFFGSDAAPLVVDMEEGHAIGSWNGRRFETTFSNIEHVSGGPFFNTLVGSEGDDTFEGTRGFDIIVIDMAGGNDTILHFPDGDDIIWLDSALVEDYGLTHADVIDAARQDGADVLIDLTMYGMGTIRLLNFNIDWLRIEHISL